LFIDVRGGVGVCVRVLVLAVTRLSACCRLLGYGCLRVVRVVSSCCSGERKELMETFTTVPLLIIDDLGMRKLPINAAEDLLELIMRRHGRAATLLTSNRPADDWGKLLGDTPAVTAMLDRLLHHGHVLHCGPKSWRMKEHAALRRTETND